MRRIFPQKLSPQRKLIIKATYDFYGSSLPKNSPLIKEVALYIMGRRKRIQLNEEQQSALLYIKQNLTDSVYRKALVA